MFYFKENITAIFIFLKSPIMFYFLLFFAYNPPRKYIEKEVYIHRPIFYL